MKKNSTYRTSALILAIVFCLFNVGLPIVISACPMMKAGSSNASCCITTEKLSEQTVAISRNTSCCRTILAADRNTTEFLQSNTPICQILKVESLPFIVTSDVSAGVRLQILPVNLRSGTNIPLVPDDDIPVFISSLLI